MPDASAVASAVDPLGVASTFVGNAMWAVGIVAVYYYIFKPRPAPSASGKRSAPAIFFEGLANLEQDPFGWLDESSASSKRSPLFYDVAEQPRQREFSKGVVKPGSAQAAVEREQSQVKAGAGPSRWERRKQAKAAGKRRY
jgi:hypothetical protein